MSILGHHCNGLVRWSVALTLAITGCHSVPTPVTRRVHAAQKDVVLYQVELSGPTSPLKYFELAERELAESGRRIAHSSDSGAPIYEINMVFHVGMRRLATVTFRLDESQDDRLRHYQTLVFHPQPRTISRRGETRE
ncbi:MAG: hypothetical protein ACKVX7_10110 [Planctomycetota bacterium]